MESSIIHCLLFFFLLLPSKIESFLTIKTNVANNNHWSNNVHYRSNGGHSVEVMEKEWALYCQLLGMNCAKPTDFSFSFKGFSMRGGCTDIHADGWGLCFYEGRGLRAFHDSNAAAESPIADLVSRNPFYTFNMMAHIRYATAGQTSLENVHPFQREMVSTKKNIHNSVHKPYKNIHTFCHIFIIMT